MNRRLTALYERDARRYFLTVGAVMTVGGSAINLLWGVLAARTFGVEPGDASLPVAVSMLTPCAGALISCWFIRKDLRSLLEWTDNPSPVAERARGQLLMAALRIPLRVGIVILTAGAVIGYPVIFGVFSLVAPFDFQDLMLGVGGGFLGLLYAATFAFFGLELALRPVRSDLGSAITRAERDQIGAFSLMAKILIGLALTAVILGFTAGVLIADPDSSFLEGLRIVSIAVAVTAVIGGSLALPLAKGALSPIDDLIEGTRSVAVGDLGTQVPVTSTDEFAELVLSFNEMVEGLREREALRGHNAELVEELQASRARIVAASNEARRRVERDLHDGAQQNLVLLNLKLGQVERAVADDPAARSLVEDARAELERALVELRDLAHGIYPQVLTSDGLPAALAEAVDEAPVATELDANGAGRYPAELEAAVYFCCLEALQNAAKHAGEGVRATVRLSEHPGELRFEVADDGRGFDTATANGSRGLQNMADRIGALGGDVRVESKPGGGTRVRGSVPVEA